MKKLILLMFAGIFSMFYACKEETYDIVTYNVNEPILMSFQEFRNSVKVSEQPQEITQQGKMCFYNGYLFISELGKGIHIIDNKNPSSPENVGFIELLGNADLAIRDNLLYADSYIDLVWFDISDPSKPVLKGRLEEVFPNALPPVAHIECGIDYNKIYEPDGKMKGIVVGWNLVEKKESVKDYRYYYDYGLLYSDKANFNNAGNQGVNGSMARFGIYKEYMYTVINNYLSVFDISGNQPQKATQDIYTGYDVETIFSYEDKLFMGTPIGLLIYSVENPLDPKHKSFIGHIWGCDPVVVENDIAYVTVRSGNICGQNANELIIIDVSNVESPKPIVTYNMTNPKGLGIDNGTLFLCDDGLKIYDAKDPLTLMGKRIAHYSGMDAFDVIPYNHVLMMIAEDGIYQYDYSNLSDIKQLSKIEYVNK